MFITTATCIFDFFHWDVPLQNKIDLTTLYGPYLALSKCFLEASYERRRHLCNEDVVLTCGPSGIHAGGYDCQTQPRD